LSITVHEDVIEAFNKISRRPQKLYGCILVMNDGGTEVSVEKELEKGSTYDDFIACFPATAPRFGIVNYAYELEDKRKKSQVLFFVYVPDACSEVAVKFYYSNAKAPLKDKCQPLHKEF
jgi:cofilin